MIARLIVLALLAVAAATTRPADIPDLRTGNINGSSALLFWPASMPASEDQEVQPLPSANGCEAHLVSQEDMDKELRFACGKWFAPPVGKYAYWLETDGGMTPTMNILIYTAAPFQGRGMGSITPVAPAGRLTIPANRPVPDQESLRIVSTHAIHSLSQAPWIFDRRIPNRDVRSPVQMPAGGAVIGRFDRKTNDAIALSRPVEVKAGRTVSAWPEPPSASDVLLVLEKPPEIRRSNEEGAARLILSDGTKSRSADVMVDGGNRILAIWYEVEARRATISLESDLLFWAPREVNLVRGKVTTIRSHAEKLPSVKVSVTAPMEADLPADMVLEVTRSGGTGPLRRVTVQAGVHEVAALPAEPLRFTLKLNSWKLVNDVDLSSGQDAITAFELEPVLVSGTVFYGDDPVPARIAFLNGEEWPAVQTDEHGVYQTTLWWPDVYTARVTVSGRNQPPFLDAFREIFESGTVDFHIPRTDYRVRVRDASTGQGISGARVTAGSVWSDESSRGRQEAQSVMTDESGLAILPPIRKGELIVEVKADRYAPAAPLRLTVDDEHHELDVALQPMRMTGRLNLLLPNGSEAAQAGVWALDEAMQPVWQGASDPSGTIQIPEVANGALLLLRHPGAASTIRRWEATEDLVTWTLGAPAEPLTLVAEPQARDRASGAHVVLWLDGVKLSGPALALATWSVPVMDPSGTWVGRNLPPRALQVLALRRDRYEAIAARAFDAVARRVEYPWRGAVVSPISQ